MASTKAIPFIITPSKTTTHTAYMVECDYIITLAILLPHHIL